MKRLFFILFLTLQTLSAYARDQVLVRYNTNIVDVLHLSNLEGSGINALLQLKGGCYKGSQINTIDVLNDVFNMAERNKIAANWSIRFRQATTPNIPEQNSGLADSIGIEYEIKKDNYPIVRFTINRCH